MMIWPYLMGLSAVVTLVAALSRQMPLTKAAGAILAAYFAARILKAGVPPEFQLVAFAALWVSVGGFVLRQCGLVVPALLLVVCSLCYLWARLTAAPWVVGSVPFVISDILAVAAMLWIGGAAAHVLIRDGYLGGNSDRRGAGLGTGSGVATQAQDEA